MNDLKVGALGVASGVLGLALPIHFKHALNSVITLLYMKPVANNGTDFICGSLLRARH